MVSRLAFQEMPVSKPAHSVLLFSQTPALRDRPGSHIYYHFRHMMFAISCFDWLQMSPGVPKKEIPTTVRSLASMTTVDTSVVKREKPKSDATVKSHILK